MRSPAIRYALALLLCTLPLLACNALNIDASDGSGDGDGPFSALSGFADRVLGGDESEGTSAPAASSGKTEYFQYTDERGSVHFVSSIHEVPAQFRKQVGRVELENRPIRVEPKATAARTGNRPFAYDPGTAAKNVEAVVYTTSWCGWCRKTASWLDEQGVPYENRDIEARDEYREEILRHTGGTSVPVVVIDGEVVRGFNPERMKELIGS